MTATLLGCSARWISHCWRGEFARLVWRCPRSSKFIPSPRPRRGEEQIACLTLDPIVQHFGPDFPNTEDVTMHWLMVLLEWLVDRLGQRRLVPAVVPARTVGGRMNNREIESAVERSRCGVCPRGIEALDRWSWGCLDLWGCGPPRGGYERGRWYDRIERLAEFIHSFGVLRTRARRWRSEARSRQAQDVNRVWLAHVTCQDDTSPGCSVIIQYSSQYPPHHDLHVKSSYLFLAGRIA